MAKTTTASAFERLIIRLSRLPGIGRRSAERIAFHLLRVSQDEALELADAIRAFKADLTACEDCGYVSETSPCPICLDQERDKATILVVEQPTDIANLEQTGAYRGLYHVLMGRLSPLDAVGPGDLNIQRLLERVESGGIREVVLGLNPTLEGDGTALYLADELQKRGIKVSRLARGMPTGSTLATVSKAVLSDAIQGRQAVAG